jgi:nuclear GTP-binding protein
LSLFVSSHCVESSKKNFFKEFKKVVKMADVVLEVLDARDPLGCRSYTTEQQILSLDPNKKIILVLNKIGTSLF